MLCVFIFPSISWNSTLQRCMPVSCFFVACWSFSDSSCMVRMRLPNPRLLLNRATEDEGFGKLNWIFFLLFLKQKIFWFCSSPPAVIFSKASWVVSHPCSYLQGFQPNTHTAYAACTKNLTMQMPFVGHLRAAKTGCWHIFHINQNLSNSILLSTYFKYSLMFHRVFFFS